MHPVSFPGSVEIGKPKDMTDEQCYSVWATRGLDGLMKIIDPKEEGVKMPEVFAGVDANKFPYFLTAWKPNKEDLEALNRGEPIYVKTLSTGLPPMALFTLDETTKEIFNPKKTPTNKFN